MPKKRRWSLSELLDFEWLLRSEAPRSEGAERSLFRKAVRPEIEGLKKAEDRRRMGMLVWFRARREASVDLAQAPGVRVNAALNLAGLLLIVVLFSTGASLVWGMVERPERMINLGVFLAAAIGSQVLTLLLSLAVIVFRRRIAAGFSLLGSVVLSGVFFLSRGAGRESWDGLVKGSERYRAVAVWTLARIGQSGAVAFNVGLLSGLAGLLIVTDVRMYWETTSDDEPERVAKSVVDVIAAPWAFVPGGPQPSLEAVRDARLVAGDGGAEDLRPQGAAWPSFLFAAVLVWGFLPRFLLWVLSIWGQRRAFDALDFQAARHRELWRKMSHVDRLVDTGGQMDEAVVIDCGGSGVELATFADFIRAKLRLFPTGKYELGVMDAAREEEAKAALAKAKAGVVLLVEGWDLSPKQVTERHAMLRRLIGEQLQIWYVVHNDGAPSASDDEMVAWKKTIDDIADAAADVVAYQEVAFAKQEGGEG